MAVCAIREIGCRTVVSIDLKVSATVAGSSQKLDPQTRSAFQDRLEPLAHATIEIDGAVLRATRAHARELNLILLYSISIEIVFLNRHSLLRRTRSTFLLLETLAQLRLFREHLLKQLRAHFFRRPREIESFSD